MKINSISQTVSFYVDATDDNGTEKNFRRGQWGIWEELMGESWEPIYFGEDELEQAFQDYIMTFRQSYSLTD